MPKPQLLGLFLLCTAFMSCDNPNVGSPGESSAPLSVTYTKKTELYFGTYYLTITGGKSRHEVDGAFADRKTVTVDGVTIVYERTRKPPTGIIVRIGPREFPMPQVDELVVAFAEDGSGRYSLSIQGTPYDPE